MLKIIEICKRPVLKIAAVTILASAILLPSLSDAVVVVVQPGYHRYYYNGHYYANRYYYGGHYYYHRNYYGGRYRYY